MLQNFILNKLLKTKRCRLVSLKSKELIYPITDVLHQHFDREFESLLCKTQGLGTQFLHPQKQLNAHFVFDTPLIVDQRQYATVKQLVDVPTVRVTVENFHQQPTHVILLVSNNRFARDVVRDRDQLRFRLYD